MDGEPGARPRRARLERRGSAPGRAGVRYGHRNGSRICAEGPSRYCMYWAGVTQGHDRRDASIVALGADAALVRTPSYFKPHMTDDAFMAHYTAVAESSPIPVVLYNFTALTGVTLSVGVVARLAEHPNIVGMKESRSDAGFVSALVDGTPDDFCVLVGSAPMFYASLRAGAVGGIIALASVAPDECVELFDLVQSGRHDEARQLQERLTPLARLVTRAHGVAGLKAALDLLGYVGGSPRPPLRPVSDEAVAELKTGAGGPGYADEERHSGCSFRRGEAEPGSGLIRKQRPRLRQNLKLGRRTQTEKRTEKRRLVRAASMMVDN